MDNSEEKVKSGTEAEEVKAEEKTEAEKADSPEDTKKEKKKVKKLESELEKAKADIKKTEEKLDELNDRYMRMLAEYDNYRRRTAKEHDNIYGDAYGDAVKQILPVIDNLERAAMYKDSDSVAKGVQMTLKSCNDMSAKLGITEIETKKFDPAFHNAVMHIEDEAYGEGEIVEVLQKGYMKGDKVIRYAMVKVAN